MSKTRKRHPQPDWLRQLPPGIVGHGPARLYFYLCAGGPNTCTFWNFRIAREFHVSRSTIKRWIKRLNDLALITIEKGRSPYRRIHPLYYRSSKEFIHSAQAKEIRTGIGKIGKIAKFQRTTCEPQDLDKRIHYNSLTSKGRASKLARPFTKTAQAPRGLAVQDPAIAEMMAYRKEQTMKEVAEVCARANKIKRRKPKWEHQ